MITAPDEYPIHQIPEPIAFSGTDRNFYDRYFFNGFNPDGSEFFAVALGVYPHLNIADAHFSVVRNGIQHCIHASRFLGASRMDLNVGPISIRIVEPLQRLRVILTPADGIAADILFEGRAFPIHEPRFTHRFGTRTFMDLTRMTQNMRVSGWIEVDGVQRDLSAGALGTRDRSWGVRGIGAPDLQPLAPPSVPGIFWIWTPLHVGRTNYFFHVMAQANGEVWNTRAALCTDGAGAADIVSSHGARIDVVLKSGLRHCASGIIHVPLRDRAIEIHLEPRARFQMQGVGYGHPKWAHGLNHGELRVAREDLVLDKLDPLAPENLHVQNFVEVLLRQSGRADEFGIGSFEQAIVGPYQPLRLGPTGAAAP